jgi:hypothetical protein
MTQAERETFVKNFGSQIPDALEKLLADQSLRAALPACFRFTSVPFVLEIQYLTNLEDPANYDLANNRVVFAISTDGHGVIADLSDHELKIMQSEFGDVDYLGITVQDLRDASVTSI